jgi:hypothetical protein
MNIIVNLWAVVACAVASMIVGSIWYGPLFGKTFIAATGMDQWPAEKKAAMKAKMAWSYVGQFIASLLMFYILATFIVWSSPVLNVRFGMGVSFFMWLGFIVPVKYADTLWGGKMSLFWLSIGNMLITMLVAGAIIGAWR